MALRGLAGWVRRLLRSGPEFRWTSDWGMMPREGSVHERGARVRRGSWAEVVTAKDGGRAAGVAWRGSRRAESGARVTGGTIARWRERFRAGGQAAVKSRPADERDELRRLRAKVGELTVEVEVMGRAASLSTGRRYGLARVCRVLEAPRSTAYAARTRRLAPAPPAEDGAHRCRADRPDPRRPGAVAVRGRGVPQGLGTPAPGRGPGRQAARPPADA
jgi:hypothetical protein